MEKQLMELEGTPECGTRTLGHSPSDEGNAPMKKQMKEPLKEAFSISETSCSS